MTRAAGCLVILALWLAACAGTQPRILDVSSHQRTHTIMAQDEEFFVTDRASQISTKPELLPAEQQRQEFLVRWTPRDMQRVKFEYRQVNRPNITGEQAQDIAGLRQAQFKIKLPVRTTPVADRSRPGG